MRQDQDEALFKVSMAQSPSPTTRPIATLPTTRPFPPSPTTRPGARKPLTTTLPLPLPTTPQICQDHCVSTVYVSWSNPNQHNPKIYISLKGRKESAYNFIELTHLMYLK